jgi:hypothetical protein
MANSSFLPTLPQSDIVQAAQVHPLCSPELPLPDPSQLIQQAYSPASAGSSGAQRRLQQELFDIQKRYEAWGLVIPFLNHDDVNVQFFGAHTVQVKIARDWWVSDHARRVGRLTRARDTFPPDNATSLRDMVLELTSHSIVTGKSKIILRKLFVAVIRLAFRRTLVCLTGAFRSRRWR